MGYLYGIWGCFIVFAAAGLYRVLVVRRIRAELGASIGEWNLNYIELLKEHRSRFPVSRTRSLCNSLMAVTLVASAVGVVLTIAAQFQPHSLYHLIFAAR